MKASPKNWVLILSLCALVPVLILLSLKVLSSKAAKPLYVDWNESGSCYIATYVPNYNFLGVVVGRVFKYFSSPYFYRVYTKNDDLLKTSEWYLWRDEGSPGIAPEFRGEMIVYPGSEGWESWIVSECR
ncbi:MULTISPECIES: hypothetical protein [unclassified Pseudomonas]|jgi:hypothetical protein|uniref:hypothetical protein n=1 Tax=unclassified Pseudomonas TaxID=196821 RepID=UPI000CB6323A|nr:MULTISPECIES: hypothetical protein [unclassified Pseudomonas]PMQ11023.1 hypothetical protein PseAD21_14465 [Pseudomonas sp. AD21]